MMRGVISGIKRMEIHDGDGLRTTVFFKGCPLRCLWCHNPESLNRTPELACFRAKCIGCGTCSSVCPTGAVRNGTVDETQCRKCFRCADACPTEALVGFGQTVTADEVFELVKPDFPYFANGRGGVTLSGGECLFQPEFAVVCAKRFSEEGISVDIDTCGFAPFSVFEKILPYTDTFLFDVKAVDRERHRFLTGQDNAVILENLKQLSLRGAKIEIRYPFAIGYNDGECAKIGGLLSTLNGIKKVKVLPLHRFAASRYEALGKPVTLPPETAVPSAEQMRSAVQTLCGFGLNAVNGAKDD